MKLPAINIKKYFLIAINESQRQLTYRANISAYNIGNIFELAGQLIIWSVIFSKVSIVSGYTYQEMMTYIAVGWFIMFASSNYGFEEKIAKDIQLGTLSNYIIKPFSYLRFITSVSIGRITFAFLVVVLTEVALMLFLHSFLLFNWSLKVLGIMFAMMLFSYFINFFFSVLIGMLAFWFSEVSGVYSSFNKINKFLSGAYFPLALLPAAYLKTSLWFPFAYTFFIPIQLYLGKISLIDGIKAIGIQAVWLFILYGIIKFVWHLGLRRYESAGI